MRWTGNTFSQIVWNEYYWSKVYCRITPFQADAETYLPLHCHLIHIWMNILMYVYCIQNVVFFCVCSLCETKYYGSENVEVSNAWYAHKLNVSKRKRQSMKSNRLGMKLVLICMISHLYQSFKTTEQPVAQKNNQRNMRREKKL